MMRYFGLFLLSLLLLGCTPTSPILPVGTAEPESPALEVVPTLAIAPTTAVVIDPEHAYPAPPTLAPPPEGYPPAPPVSATISAYPSLNDQPSLAQAHVTFVRATQAADNSWTFEVTIEYANATAEAYADGWDIITPEGQVLKKEVSDAYTQPLPPPSTTEETITHSLDGLTIPSDVTQFFVRAHDSVNGWGGQMVFVDLTTPEGLNYEVVRE